jgi:hypothetical protein
MTVKELNLKKQKSQSMRGRPLTLHTRSVAPGSKLGSKFSSTTSIDNMNKSEDGINIMSEK